MGDAVAAEAALATLAHVVTPCHMFEGFRGGVVQAASGVSMEGQDRAGVTGCRFQPFQPAEGLHVTFAWSPTGDQLPELTRVHQRMLVQDKTYDSETSDYDATIKRGRDTRVP